MSSRDFDDTTNTTGGGGTGAAGSTGLGGSTGGGSFGSGGGGASASGDPSQWGTGGGSTGLSTTGGGYGAGTGTAAGGGAGADTSAGGGTGAATGIASQAKEYGQKVADAATQARDYVTERASALGTTVSDKFKDLQNVDYQRYAEDAKEYARQKPGQALLISAAAGFLLGLLIRGSRR